MGNKHYIITYENATPEAGERILEQKGVSVFHKGSDSGLSYIVCYTELSEEELSDAIWEVNQGAYCLVEIDEEELPGWKNWNTNII